MSAAPRGLERFQALPRYRRWAALASLVWVVVVTSYAIGFFGGDAAASRGTVFIDGLFFLIALILPLMLIWLAAWLAEELERQREVLAALAELTPPLIEAMAATRAALERHAPVSPETIEAAVRHGLAAASAASPEIDPRPALTNLAANQARMEGALRELLGRAAPPAPPAEPPVPETAAPRARKVTQRRRADDVPRQVPEPAAEPTLPLLPEGEPDLRPSWADLVRALNFPRDDRDTEGFRALKSALRHHSLAQMLQAAEDVLTMLSQHGIYMDDLQPAERDPDAWRRFIAGTRGAEVDAVGAIRDPRALEVARGLMKSDPIFRDTALFFHRRFDGVLGEFASGAGDDRLLELADTRSGRAFMLLARLNGAFG